MRDLRLVYELASLLGNKKREVFSEDIPESVFQEARVLGVGDSYDELNGLWRGIYPTKAPRIRRGATR